MSKESPSTQERDALTRSAHYDRAILRARHRSSVIAIAFALACMAGLALSLAVPFYQGWGEAGILVPLASVLLAIGAALTWLFRHQARLSARLGMENIGELVEFARHAEQRERVRVARSALGWTTRRLNWANSASPERGAVDSCTHPMRATDGPSKERVPREHVTTSSG